MHTKPEVLALLALGEHPADAADRAHLADCPRCRADVDALAQLVAGGRTAAPDAETPDAPSEAVWAAIQSELGFIPVTRTWPTVPEPAPEPAPAAAPAASVEPGAGTPVIDAQRDGASRRGRRIVTVVLLVLLAVAIAVILGVQLSP